MGTIEKALVTGAMSKDDDPYFIALIKSGMRTAVLRRDVFSKGPAISFGDLIKATYTEDFSVTDYSIIKKNPYNAKPNSRTLQCRVFVSYENGNLTFKNDDLGYLVAPDSLKNTPQGYYKANFNSIRHPSRNNCSQLVIQKLIEETSSASPVGEQFEDNVEGVGIIVQRLEVPSKQKGTMKLVYIWSKGTSPRCDGTAIEMVGGDKYNIGDIVAFEALGHEYAKRMSSSYRIHRIRKLDPGSEEAKSLGFTVHVTPDKMVEIEVKDVFVGEITTETVEIPHVGPVLAYNKIEQYTFYDSVRLLKVCQRNLPSSWRVSEVKPNPTFTQLIRALRAVMADDSLADMIETRHSAVFKMLQSFVKTGALD